MKEVSILDVDLTEQVFQLRGKAKLCSQKLSRKQFVASMQTHPA